MKSLLLGHYLCLLGCGEVLSSVLRERGAGSRSRRSYDVPALHGPGFNCEPAFGDEAPSLDTLLLCNKTSHGQHFNKTVIQTLNTAVFRLGEGQCEEFHSIGFRCKEHYECLGDSFLITDGKSQTEIISVLTTVDVHSSVPGASYNYNYSILDATDKKCQTYTKVCCGSNKKPGDTKTEKEITPPTQTLTSKEVTEASVVIEDTTKQNKQKDPMQGKTIECKNSKLKLSSIVGLRSDNDCSSTFETNTEVNSEKITTEKDTTKKNGIPIEEENQTENIITSVEEVTKSVLVAEMTDSTLLIGETVILKNPNKDDAIMCKSAKLKLSSIVGLRDNYELDCDSMVEETPNSEMDKSPKPEPPKDFVPQCGRHNPDGYRQSVVNLEQSLHESQFAEWPNMCAIMENGVYKCGASLVSPSFVLTAAHCFNSSVAVSGLSVRCGDWDTNTEREIYRHQEQPVLQVTSHPEFDTDLGARGNLQNDIALVQTSHKFSLAPHVDTICLPRPGEKFDGMQCAATGWGKDRFGNKSEIQIILKEVWMNVVKNERCQEKLRKTKLGMHFILDTSFICAGGEKDSDMCTGDGGSPLMCEGQGGFVQAGIVSWGIECGLPDVPGGYVNVSKYVCWIKNIVEKVEGNDYFPYGEECIEEEDDYDLRNL